MSEEKASGSFEQWCIVELFGHNQIAGLVTEVGAFGTSLMRVDVPGVNGNPGFTKFYGGEAIYGITPTTQEIVIEAAKRLDIRPVSLWIIPDPKPQLPPVTVHSDEYGYDDEEDDDEDRGAIKKKDDGIPF